MTEDRQLSGNITQRPRGMRRAPLALFVYRKFQAPLDVIDALSRCDGFADTPVFVFSDGPRTANEEEPVQALRAAIRSLALTNVTVIARDRNLGLADSVASGVSQLCAEYGRTIVLEDDHRPAPAMLNWFNSALHMYQSDDRVGAISGHIFDVPKIRTHGQGVFFWHPASPCWAVWERSWSLYDAHCTDWTKWMQDEEYSRLFRVHGAMRFEHMMRDLKAGRSNSWAIRWHASIIRHKKLVLYPPQSMVLPLETDSRFASNGNRTGWLLRLSPPWKGTTPPPLPQDTAIDDWAVRAWANSLRFSAYGLAQFVASIVYDWRHPPEPRALK